MIIVKLWGGMCNQMFQYAFGYALSKRHNDQLFFDVDFYNNQPKHVGKRQIIDSNLFPNLPNLHFAKRPGIVKPLENKYISHLIRYNTGCRMSLPGNIHFMMEKLHLYYKEVPYKASMTNYYDGYWQTSRYFSDCEEEIRRLFSPWPDVLERAESWRKNIQSPQCVAVHIRRGDYLSKINQATLHEGNVIGDVDYYLRAIDYMNSQLNNPTYCFFSDDINWCKEAFHEKTPNAVFVENSGEDAAILDLFSIAQCEHGIMSPSTFSWWGNWLREKKDSIVIAPKGEHSNQQFIESKWIAL